MPSSEHPQIWPFILGKMEETEKKSFAQDHTAGDQSLSIIQLSYQFEGDNSLFMLQY